MTSAARVLLPLLYIHYKHLPVNENMLRVKLRSGRRFAPSILWRGWKPRPSTACLGR